MFSSLASYLFGSSTTTDPVDNNTTNSTAEEVVFKQPEEANIVVKKKNCKKDKKRSNKSKREDKENCNDLIEDDEDDWFFIEREDGVEEIPRSESEEDLDIVELKTPQKPKYIRKKRNSKKRSPVAKTSGSVKDYDAVSQSLYAVPACIQEPEANANHSLLSICDTTLTIPANLSMEESWFLTPPPIFTSTGPIHMELSPFENLLIEHPSMSVYHSIRSAREATESFVNLDLGIEESQSNTENVSVEQRTPTNSEAVAVQQRTGNRVERLAAKQTKESVMIRKSQKAHDKRDKQNLSRGAIKRSNNVCLFLSKGSNRPRRSDLQHCKVLSGFNNNRKC